MKRIIIAVFLILLPAFALAQPAVNMTNVTAQGGNVTFLDLNSSFQTTDSWQGFYGTVTGGIYLQNADGDSFYDWEVVDASGEILAARSLIADWSAINCTSQTELYLEEERLNIQNSSLQGINDTYLNVSHPPFDVGGKYLNGCRSTLTNNESGMKDVFWNVLLNANSSTTVYTVIMDNDRIGFNGSVSDFQLLVPIDIVTGTAFYNIYVELN